KGELLKAGIGIAPRLLELTQFDAQPRGIFAVEPAQGIAGPIDRLGELLPGAGSPRRLPRLQYSQQNAGDDDQRAHRKVPLRPRSRRLSYGENMSIGQTLEAKLCDKKPPLGTRPEPGPSRTPRGDGARVNVEAQMSITSSTPGSAESAP